MGAAVALTLWQIPATAGIGTVVGYLTMLVGLAELLPRRVTHQQLVDIHRHRRERAADMGAIAIAGEELILTAAITQRMLLVANGFTLKGAVSYGKTSEYMGSGEFMAEVTGDPQWANPQHEVWRKLYEAAHQGDPFGLRWQERQHVAA